MRNSRAFAQSWFRNQCRDPFTPTAIGVMANRITGPGTGTSEYGRARGAEPLSRTVLACFGQKTGQVTAHSPA